MTAPVVPQLGASTVNRKWILEVLISGTYTPVGGVKNFAPTTDDANMEDDGRYSDGGYSRSNKTGTGWNATATVSRAPQAGNLAAYDAAQEYIRAHGEGQLGNNAQVSVRFYEFDSNPALPRVQAYQGTALVSWNEPGGERTGNSEATITLTGQGQLNSITHPYPSTPVAPVIASVAPTALPASTTGKLVRITGAGFTTTIANGVKFGAVAAPSFDVENDGLIIATVPSTAASTVAVTVQNSAGTSAGVNVTFS